MERSFVPAVLRVLGAIFLLVVTAAMLLTISSLAGSSGLRGLTSTPDVSSGNGAVRVLASREITVTGPITPGWKVGFYDVYSQTMVANVGLGHQGAIVAVDLVSGSARFLALPEIEPLPTSRGKAEIWGRTVAWPVYSGPDNGVIHLYNLDNAVESTTTAVTRGALSFRYDVLAWDHNDMDGAYAIYGYDLQSGRSFTVTTSISQAGQAFYPRVCSRQWIIYVTNYHSVAKGTWWGDLKAYNWTTGQELVVAHLVLPDASEYLSALEGWHACDGQTVAWVSRGPDELYHPYVYDLGSNTLTTLPFERRRGEPVLSTQLDNDILLNMTFYDLRAHAPLVLPVQRGDLQLLSSQLFWIPQEDRGGERDIFLHRIFVASLVRSR